MKKLISPFKGFVLLAVALAPLFTRAGDGDRIDKKRTISKSYTVGPDDKLSIENSFGDITVSTWDRAEIQVNIEIGVHATSEDKAEKMMSEISVSDHQDSHDITFKTDIGRMGKGNTNGNSGDDVRRFYVDYKVSMPSANALRIENSFGKVRIPDFTGTADLTSKFGEMTTGNISRAKMIHVEFGKAAIGQLTNADVVFKFNSKSDVAGLSGNSKVDVQFCNQVSISVDNTVHELSLFQSYSTINLRVPDDLSAQFHVYTNFGSFKNKTEFHITEEQTDESSGPKFDKNYSGSAGAGAARIKIKSSFGSVRMANVNDKSIDTDNKKENRRGKNDDDDDDDDEKEDVKDKVDL